MLVERMGLPELADDPRFADFEARNHSRDVLIAILSGRFAERTTAEWLETLRGRDPDRAGAFHGGRARSRGARGSGDARGI